MVHRLDFDLGLHRLADGGGSRDYPVIPTLKLRSNRPLYSNTLIGTLAIYGWAVTFGTASRGLGVPGPRPVPSSLYQM